MKFLLISLFFTCLAGQTFAHSYFVTELKMDNGTSVGDVEAYIHDGEWVWTLNSTVPLQTAEIADRRGGALNPILTNLVDLDLQKEPEKIEAGSILRYNGTFDDTAIETSNMPNLFKEERNMTNALQLAGHMCMGHIFVVANGTDGMSAYGPLTFAKDGDCYEGTGTESMRMPMGSSMGGDTNHSADGHDHGNMEESNVAAMGSSSGIIVTSMWSFAAASIIAMLSTSV